MSPKLLLFLTILSLLSVHSAFSARILGLFYMPSKSHHILGGRLLKSLAERGHEVTMVSPYPSKNPVKNYRDIFIPEMLQFKQNDMQKFMRPLANQSSSDMFAGGVKIFYKAAELVLSNADIQRLMRDEKFDLILQYGIFADGLLGLSHHFQVPVILVSTLGALPGHNDITGNPAPPSYLAPIMFPMPDKMTFLQRVTSTLSAIGNPLVWKYFMAEPQRELLKKHFPDAPSLEELSKNIAMVFLNTHYSIESPRPYLPNMIQLAGLHVEEPKDLPSDLKEFLDSASAGAIFFSLGSNAQLSDFPEDKFNAIVKALGKVKQKVLLKSDVDIANLPDNIKTGKWLPQNDILAHPNVKLFISHGGLLSTIEAIYHAVPIIGIPIFGDQPMNIADAVYKGYALKVAFEELTEDNLDSAIQEALTNPQYKQNIERRSLIMHEQPVKPLDHAIFWVEHVLKHRGADHLKCAGADLPLYQYFLIDTLSFIAAVVFIVVYTFLWLVRKFFRKMKSLLFRSSSVNKKNQ